MDTTRKTVLTVGHELTQRDLKECRRVLREAGFHHLHYEYGVGIKEVVDGAKYQTENVHLLEYAELDYDLYDFCYLHGKEMLGMYIEMPWDTQLVEFDVYIRQRENSELIDNVSVWGWRNAATGRMIWLDHRPEDNELLQLAVADINSK